MRLNKIKFTELAFNLTAMADACFITQVYELTEVELEISCDQL
jgi:hypothetical protein